MQVYADASSGEALIVEVVEYNNDVRDADLAEWLFQDLADVNDAASAVLDSTCMLGALLALDIDSHAGWPRPPTGHARPHLCRHALAVAAPSTPPSQCTFTAHSRALLSDTATGSDDMPGVPSALVKCLCRGVQHFENPAASSGSSPAAESVRVCVAALRLPRYRAELLITLNSPIVRSPSGGGRQDACLVDGAGAAAHSRVLFAGMLTSLTIVDWDLFGEGSNDGR